jgi:hypothetical protein
MTKTTTMTEQAPERKRKGPPALASRILAIGVSAAATLGLVGAMAAGASDASGSEPPVASVPSRPTKIVVVYRGASAHASAGRVAPPAVATRPASARAITSTHAS